ncbi:MAG TPA: tetratricopeptide repeat protein [Vicinamibacterales bacterium]|jgi:serine/threonine-protein kinase
MDRQQWERVKAIAGEALSRPEGDRPAYVAAQCGDDEALRAEVDSLLESTVEAGPLFETPALGVTAAQFAESIGSAGSASPGARVGPYRVLREIGRGGMGAVYLAERSDGEFEQRVAIKFVHWNLASAALPGRTDAIRRFRNERQVLASLSHPHIAALYDGGTTADGLPYFVMEYVPGVPIDRYAQEQQLDIDARIELCLPILDAVQHAHDRHVIHRDIKPGNVLVTADGQAKLLDFGIAKLLEPGHEGASTLTNIGPSMTPEYATPEQVRGAAITPATDVYALGLLLYELLTGRRPYQLTTRTPEEITRVVCEQEPERPSRAAVQDNPAQTASMARVLDDILLKALRKEPDRRYASAAALADDLRRYLARERVPVAWDARAYRTRSFFRRHRLSIGAAVLVAIAISATAIVATVANSRRQAARTDAASTAPRAARRSVAILGFRNLSQRPTDDWMSTAIAEMLRTELESDGQLRVLPPDRVARAERDLRVDAQSPEGVERLRTALESDYVVHGTFAVADSPGATTLRIDARAVAGSQPSIASAGTGDQTSLFTTVATIGHDLRAHLGLRASPADATERARAAFPQTLEVTKLYAEGMTRLRLLDAVNARDSLEMAAAREPGNPMVQTALASAWSALGYDKRAADAAERAFKASEGLSREERLTIEGRLYEAQRQWTKAADVYRTLWGFFSDNVEYGLRLAAVQRSDGHAKDALATVEAMRRLEPPQNADPRIDLEESQAASAIGDFKRELAAVQRVVKRAEDNGSRELLGRARLLEGRGYYNQGQLALAEQSLERARQLFVDVGDRASAATTLNTLAAVLGDEQDITRAERMQQESLAVSEEIGDRRSMSSALNNLGIFLKDQRRFDEARQAHERALALRREIGDQNWTAVSLSNIGVVLFEQDRYPEALKYYNDSLAICRQIGDRRGEVRALHNIAIVQRQMGQLDAARAGYNESLAIRTELGDKRGEVMGRVELGAVLLAQAEVVLAKQTEQLAATRAREIRLRPGEAQALYQLGEIALAAGDLAEARRLHEEALAIRTELKETRTILESRLALASLTLEDGSAEEAGRAAAQLADEVGNSPGDALRLPVKILVARSDVARRDTAGARRALDEARGLSQATQRVDEHYALALAEAELDLAVGQSQLARSRLTDVQPALQRNGMVLADLECRAQLLRIDRADGRPNVRADAAKLEREARTHGVGLIARRVRDAGSTQAAK